MMTRHEIETLAEALADKLSQRITLHNSSTSDETMLDVHGAAALLGCSVPTVERHSRSGLIPSVKVGRLRRYRRADLLGLSGKTGETHE